VNTLTVHRVDRKAIPVERRSAFTSLANRLSDEVCAAAARSGEDVVVLSTCERFEAYCANGRSSNSTELLDRSELNLFGAVLSAGHDALRHLFRVASGLESRLRGEPHVLGQVRLALNQANQRTAVHGTVADAFTYAIRCGRRVRRVTAFGSLDSSYTFWAVEWLTRNLNGLEGRHVAVVGSGALASEVAHALREAGVGGLTIVGRHEARVAEVAGNAGADWMTLHSLNTSPTNFSAIVTAVASPEPVIKPDTLRLCGARLFVDLGAAPNVDRFVDGVPDILVARLEDLGGGGPESVAFAQAEAIVEHELTRYRATRASNVRDWHMAAGRIAS
jgi:glutamyl-tRNA reductase